MAVKSSTGVVIKITQIYGGTNEVQQIKMARQRPNGVQSSLYLVRLQ